MDRYTGEFIAIKDNVEKIKELSNSNGVAVSCWGLAEVDEVGQPKKDIMPFLEEFNNTYIAKGDNIDQVAAKLKSRLESVLPKIDQSMGFHIAGYVMTGDHPAPHLRHVFHSSGQPSGQFVNEDCHNEYHLPNGDKVIHHVRKDCPVLFNGENLIANALFNYASYIRPQFRIIPDRLSLEECVELANLIVSTSINRLNYFFDMRQYKKVKQIVGGTATVATITPKGFTWIARPAPAIETVVTAAVNTDR